MAKPNIHPEIKRRLGYDPLMSDKEFLADWKKRSTQVCKPCWELKYCPYGPFVEQSPLMPPTADVAIRHIDYFRECLDSGMVGSHGVLTGHLRSSYEHHLTLYEEQPAEFAKIISSEIEREKRFTLADPTMQSFADVLGAGPLPPINEYRVPLLYENEEPEKEEKEWSSDAELVAAVESRIRYLRQSLADSVFDERKPIDPFRRAHFEKDVASFDVTQYPTTIPDVVKETECNVFGHICPVVYCGENITETSEERRRGRYIPFSLKMRVVRRDNHTCQECGKHLKDDEVEFDHIIPVAKGGSTEEHNIRLTCYDCNRSKSDKIDV